MRHWLPMRAQRLDRRREAGKRHERGQPPQGAVPRAGVGEFRQSQPGAGARSAQARAARSTRPGRHPDETHDPLERLLGITCRPPGARAGARARSSRLCQANRTRPLPSAELQEHPLPPLLRVRTTRYCTGCIRSRCGANVKVTRSIRARPGACGEPPRAGPIAAAPCAIMMAFGRGLQGAPEISCIVCCRAPARCWCGHSFRPSPMRN